MSVSLFLSYFEILSYISYISFVSHHFNKRQIVPLPTLVVVMVVGGSDLHRPRTKRHVDHLVGNDR